MMIANYVRTVSTLHSHCGVARAQNQAGAVSQNGHEAWKITVHGYPESILVEHPVTYRGQTDISPLESPLQSNQVL